MKRAILTLSLTLGAICFSCDNKIKTEKENINEATIKEVVKTRPAKIEPTLKPDTIIDGVQIYNISGKSTLKKEISLEEAISNFDRGINNARSCEELIKASATFDSDIKRISQKDSSVNISSVENRNDVKAIRKISEEKSLTMCQTQQIR